MSDLVNGLDRADGSAGRPGTPTPATALLVSGVPPVDLFEEDPDSPEIERAEQGTIQHKFKTVWARALNELAGLGRGTLLTDSFGNVSRVLSSRVQYTPGGFAELHVTAESVSFDSPPDEFQVVPVELGLNIIKHPRYLSAFIGEGYGSPTEQLNQMVIRFLQAYMENPSPPARNAIVKLIRDSMSYTGSTADPDPQFDPEAGDYIGGLIPGTDLAKAAALEIIHKFWRGEEQPYIVGFELRWIRYFFRPPFLHPGGVIEDPIYEGGLPEYFYSPTWPPQPGLTIFDALDELAPQVYSVTGNYGGGVHISWLRKADEIEFVRTWFRVTSVWIGSPIGTFDPELYTPRNRPRTPQEYVMATSAGNAQ